MNIFFFGHSSFAAQDLINKFVDNKKTFFFGRKNNNHKNFNYFNLNNISRTDFKKFKIKKIDYLFFFSSFVPLNEKNSSWNECKKINVVGLIRLLKNIKIPIKKIIFISSNSVYGENRKKLCLEDGLLYPESSYALSKFIQEQILRVYCYNNNIKFLCYRLGYVFRKNMSKKRLIKKIILNFKKKKKINLFNKNLNLNLIHTKDIDKVICNTFKKAEGTFNVSYKYKITLGDYYNKVYFNKKINNKSINNYSNKKLLKLYPKLVKTDSNKIVEDFIYE